ncbi:MAG: DUF819 family protein [Bacteroidales bacterium]
MVKIILLVLFYFTFPLVIIYMCNRWSIFKKLGAIVLAYAFGLLIGTSGILPRGSEGYKMALQGKMSIPKARLEELVKEGKATNEDIFTNQIAQAQENVVSAVIPLAFPLLLFSLNIKKWLKYAGRGFLSVALAIIAGPIMVTIGYFIFKDLIPESWRLAGMFVGIYTGGTPNFVALKMALDVDPNLFVVANTYDIFVGAFLVLFFITIAPKIFRFILPPFKSAKDETKLEVDISEITEDMDDFRGIFRKGRFLPLLGALGISILIAGVSAAIGFQFNEKFQMAAIILLITTLAILASLIKRLNRIEKTFQLGMYLIVVFSLTAATQSDLATVFSLRMMNLVLFITWCYFGSMLLHLLLAYIFRVDADNFLITSAAYIFSPPFVPLVAGALKNKNLIITGITGGVIGYLLGNYIGVGLAWLLKGF